jgi:hypothetical protein
MKEEHHFEPPIPIDIVQLFDNQCIKLVEAHLAEVIHDGSGEHSLFGQTSASKKYKKSYLIYVGEYNENHEYKVNAWATIKLIFDERYNIGYIKVSESDRKLMGEHGILNMPAPSPKLQVQEA